LTRKRDFNDLEELLVKLLFTISQIYNLTIGKSFVWVHTILGAWNYVLYIQKYHLEMYIFPFCSWIFPLEKALFYLFLMKSCIRFSNISYQHTCTYLWFPPVCFVTI
jgi:hypothetical protein